jgi:hypothetical protein
VGLISICFFGYSKKYRFLRVQGQIITPTILLKPVGGSLPFFIEIVFAGEGMAEVRSVERMVGYCFTFDFAHPEPTAVYSLLNNLRH